MSTWARWRALTALVFIGAAVAIGPAPAAAQTGPSITLDRPEVGPGEPVVVTFQGFESPFVNIVLCGNLGYRGATDCNVTAGVSKETLSGGRPKLVQLIAHPPPAHCPCIVRATASSGGEFAVAPIVITGHPVGELVGVPDGPLVDVEVEVKQANQGLWGSVRSMLGGGTRYQTTVSVRSNSTAPLTQLALSGSVGHWLGDDAVLLELEPPAGLEPGDTWTEEVLTEVPAPSVGNYEFAVVASGAGSAVTGTDTVSHHPVLFYLFAVVLVVDLMVMVWRIANRARSRKVAEADDGYDDAGWADDIDVIDLAPATSEPAPV